jgi:BCD family chlorophyll transporter-like MFS transporter
VLAILITLVVIRGIEPATSALLEADIVASEAAPKSPFMTALADVWTDPQARIFTIFVFVSMLAYSAQDLILEPFAGLVFDRTPGESTQLAGVQHAGDGGVDTVV